MVRLILLFVLVQAFQPFGGRENSQELAALLEKNRIAMGGERMQKVTSVDFSLRFEEKGQVYHGHYRAVAQGKMRIDIYVEGSRVFTEAYNGTRAWQCPAGKTKPEPSSPEGTAALRHGLEFPGHFLTFSDLRARGHQVQLVGHEPFEGKSCPILLVTLADGNQTWYILDPDTGEVLKNRSFGAPHPDADPEKKWLERRFSDYREIGGLPKAITSTEVDLISGAVLQTVTLEKAVFNQPMDPDIFEKL